MEPILTRTRKYKIQKDHAIYTGWLYKQINFYKFNLDFKMYSITVKKNSNANVKSNLSVKSLCFNLLRNLLPKCIEVFNSLCPWSVLSISTLLLTIFYIELIIVFLMYKIPNSSKIALDLWVSDTISELVRCNVSVNLLLLLINSCLLLCLVISINIIIIYIYLL